MAIVIWPPPVGVAYAMAAGNSFSPRRQPELAYSLLFILWLYYKNYCIDHHQILQSDRELQVLTVGGPNMPQTNPRWRTGAILKKIEKS